MAKKSNSSGGKSPRKKTARQIVRNAEKAKAEETTRGTSSTSAREAKVKRIRAMFDNASLNNFLMDHGTTTAETGEYNNGFPVLKEVNIEDPDHPLKKLQHEDPRAFRDTVMSYNLTPTHLRSLGFDVAEQESDEDEGPGYELISEEPVDIEDTDIDEYERENRMYGEYDYSPEDTESGFEDTDIVSKTLRKSGGRKADFDRIDEGDNTALGSTSDPVFKEAMLSGHPRARMSEADRQAARSTNPRQPQRSTFFPTKKQAANLKALTRTESAGGTSSEDPRVQIGDLAQTTEYASRGLAPTSRMIKGVAEKNRERQAVGEAITRLQNEVADSAARTADPNDTSGLPRIDENLRVTDVTNPKYVDVTTPLTGEEPDNTVRSSSSAGKVIRPTTRSTSRGSTTGRVNIARRSIFELPPGETLSPSTVAFFERNPSLQGLFGGTLAGGTTQKTAGAKIIRTGARRVGRPVGSMSETVSGNKIVSINGKIHTVDKDTGEVKPNEGLSVRQIEGTPDDNPSYELEKPLQDQPMHPLETDAEGNYKYTPVDYAGLPYTDPVEADKIRRYQAALIDAGQLPWTTGIRPKANGSNDPHTVMIPGTGTGSDNPAEFIDLSQRREKRAPTASGFSPDIEALAKKVGLEPHEVAQIHSEWSQGLHALTEMQKETPFNMSAYGESGNVLRAKRGEHKTAEQVFIDVPRAGGGMVTDRKTGEKKPLTVRTAVSRIPDKELGTGELDEEGNVIGNGILDRIQKKLIASGKPPMVLGSDEYNETVKMFSGIPKEYRVDPSTITTETQRTQETAPPLAPNPPKRIRKAQRKWRLNAIEARTMRIAGEAKVQKEQDEWRSTPEQRENLEFARAHIFGDPFGALSPMNFRRPENEHRTLNNVTFVPPNDNETDPSTARWTRLSSPGNLPKFALGTSTSGYFDEIKVNPDDFLRGGDDYYGFLARNKIIRTGQGEMARHFVHREGSEGIDPYDTSKNPYFNQSTRPTAISGDQFKVMDMATSAIRQAGMASGRVAPLPPKPERRTDALGYPVDRKGRPIPPSDPFSAGGADQVKKYNASMKAHNEMIEQKKAEREAKKAEREAKRANKGK